MTTNTLFLGDLNYKNIILHLLEGNVKVNEVTNLRDAELVYCVYGRGPKLTLKTLNFWLNNDQKFILHWIGTDVLTHINKLSNNRNIKSLIYHKLWNYLLKRKTRKGSMINLCCAPWLCDELESVGILSNYIPITTINKSEFKFDEIKRDIDFMSYLPQGRGDLYNAEEIFKLAKKLINYKFVIIVPDISNLAELKYKNISENIQFLPKIQSSEITKLYRRAKIFLRFTNHDGLSLSVIESLANRMNVCWTYNYSNVEKICLPLGKNEIDLLEEKINQWSPNYNGQNFILSELNNEVVKIKFNTACQFFFNYSYDNHS
jgi:hypothetical protein